MLELLLIARMDCVRVLCFRHKNLVQASEFPLQGRKGARALQWVIL